MTSFQSRFVNRVIIPLNGSKRYLSDTDRTREAIAANTLRPARYAPPRWLNPGVDVTLSYSEGWPVYELTPRKSQARGTVVYWHGGAYVLEIMALDWWFLAAMAVRSQTRIIVPIYPLGSVAGAQEVVTKATIISRETLVKYGNVTATLMGDSAGGGLALAVCQQLRSEGPMPKNLVLISPWLDAEVNDPRQVKLEQVDRMLAIPGLREAAREYACGLPLSDPLVSPINGGAKGLPPITIFTSTFDLLMPDSTRFEAECHNVGTPCHVFTTPAVPHAFPIIPTPEGRAARKIIYALLTT